MLLQGAKRPQSRPEELINKINALAPAAFLSRFFPSPSKLLHYRDYDISLKPVAQIGDGELMECFKLVETTSAADYKNSPRGWRPKDKLREMREDNMQYLLVRKARRTDSAHDDACLREEGSETPEDEVPEDAIVAFLAFMFTIEDDYPVVYIYEIHLAQEHRGTGLGRHLMHIVDLCAAEGAMDKVMLTCFRSNAAAMAFYAKLGFGEDEFSPPAKRLRGGKIKVPPYLIMSKSVG